jgi:hypothetical protein
MTSPWLRVMGDCRMTRARSPSTPIPQIREEFEPGAVRLVFRSLCPAMVSRY